MVSIGIMRVNKEQGMGIDRVGAVMYMLIACLSLAGCSKSGEEGAKSKPPPDISVINEGLKEYRFTREDFGDPGKVWRFLQQLVFSYYCDALRHIVCTSVSLRIAVGDDVSGWLRGSEKSTAVFRELFRDPQFMFEGNKWTVVFNVIKAGEGGGGVDEWKVVGNHDPETDTNRIEKIEITILKPEGTFSYPLNWLLASVGALTREVQHGRHLRSRTSRKTTDRHS